MVVDGNGHGYTYDNLYQLIDVDYPLGFGTDMSYYYDKLGNRTQTVNGGKVNNWQDMKIPTMQSVYLLTLQ